MFMSVGRDAEIYAEGRTAGRTRSFPAWSGSASCFPTARRQISAFHTPGDMFGLRKPDELHSRLGRSGHAGEGDRLQMAGPTAAGCRSASLVRDLLNLTMVGLRQTQEHLLLLGRQNALERVAASG